MRNTFIIVLSLFLGANTWAQQLSNDPYSSFGIGEFGGLDHAVFSGIGNANITSIDSISLNFYNPTSYTSLAQGIPLFSFSTSTRLSIHSLAGSENFSHTTNVQHFALGFSFGKRFGVAFGLKPYSRKGYEVENRFLLGSDSLVHQYIGEGSINEAFLGFGVDVLNFKGAKLTIGANLGYLFGTVDNIRKSGVITVGSSTMHGGVSYESLRAKDIHYELAATYSQRINENHYLTLTGVYDPGQKLNGVYEYGVFYSSNIDNINAFDSLTTRSTTDGNLTNIPALKLGLRYDLTFKARSGQTNELNSLMNFHLNYSMLDYQSFDNTFIDNFNNNTLNTTELNFGVQYQPERNFIVNKVTTKFYERIRYRVGAFYKTHPFSIQDEQVTDFGTTFGLGFPVLVQNSLSSINVGVTYGNKGTSNKEAIRETYFGFNIGLTIAPSTDKWFVKRKLN